MDKPTKKKLSDVRRILRESRKRVLPLDELLKRVETDRDLHQVWKLSIEETYPDRHVSRWGHSERAMAKALLADCKGAGYLLRWVVADWEAACDIVRVGLGRGDWWACPPRPLFGFVYMHREHLINAFEEANPDLGRITLQSEKKRGKLRGKKGVRVFWPGR